MGELAHAEGEQNEQLGDEVEGSAEQENESDDSEKEVTGSSENTAITDDDEPSESLGRDNADDTSKETTTDMVAGEEEGSSSFGDGDIDKQMPTIQTFPAGGFQTLATTPEDDYEWEDHGDGTVTITVIKEQILK